MLIHRTVTYGEPIDDINVSQSDDIQVQFTIKDDQGILVTDLRADVYLFMSDRDVYSGSAEYFYTSGAAVTSGVCTITFDETSTAIPGNYTCELLLTPTEDTPELTWTFDSFKFNVRAD